MPKHYERTRLKHDVGKDEGEDEGKDAGEDEGGVVHFKCVLRGVLGALRVTLWALWVGSQP